jgi:dihydroorotate dehydrogenase (fumarate)
VSPSERAGEKEVAGIDVSCCPSSATSYNPSRRGIFALSLALPNTSASPALRRYYLDKQTISDALAGTDKPYILSISGHTLADNLEMLKMIGTNAGISAVELNLACPNVIGHPIIGYDMTQLEEVLKAVSKLKLKKSLGIKMPPFFDGVHFQAAADIINKYSSSVAYVASINTIGNALVVDIDAEMPAISPKGGFGGISGPAVKYTALANVKKMRELLDESIDIVGVGGIETGADVFEMILCGASAVQVGTKHWIEGPGCFDRIAQELEELMGKKGYKRISDFQGKLKPWSKEGASISRAAKKKRGEGGAAASGGGATAAAEKQKASLYPLMCAILVALLAVLLYDKYNLTMHKIGGI